ncbi:MULTISPECIES: glycosyltransferase [Vibrio]|jgi:glycosyltransferase involved in cell wall biosynthesis|uniref:Glycosyl transferases group 1 family protein n=2 Tax=Vibrio harveyi TaxID=669 RepID=A0A454CXH0_VIBHA|nr:MULTISPECIES: glycosyltransferase [Vibrio]EKM17624.1 glycosyl transferases group 1 family protein [Vibrio harveyi]EKM31099.1 glycosyl transferases group 1 family protein [Vibrio harveyi]EKO3803858.1 glycosyltransferase [Vibrio harveyi]EKO3814739.1 glycosyltransferase [Vibrio harveyi]EKO3824618.1 glycosyltransferase [Vibrio harveyi]
MKKVLHITEAFGGGVQTALYSYVHSSRSEAFEHSLLARARSNDMTNESSNHVFSHTKWVEGNLLQFMKDANAFIAEIKPDFVHLHSSKAGFLGRFLKLGHARLIYTPHCYAFEREDISNFAKQIYKTLEKIALKKIDVVAGCSQRECDLAISIGAKRAELLNNYVTYGSEERSPNTNKTQLKLVILGRVAPQKDPQFLLDTLGQIKKAELAHDIDITWIGGGERELEDQLRAQGIKVTGMIPRDEVVSLLKTSDLYLHTAAWEGMPLTILEAAKLHLPMVIRSIGATKDLNYPFLAQGPQEMAKQITHCINHYHDIDFNQYSKELNETFSEEKQRIALISIYS